MTLLLACAGDFWTVCKPRSSALFRARNFLNFPLHLFPLKMRLSNDTNVGLDLIWPSLYHGRRHGVGFLWRGFAAREKKERLSFHTSRPPFGFLRFLMTLPCLLICQFVENINLRSILCFTIETYESVISDITLSLLKKLEPRNFSVCI